MNPCERIIGAGHGFGLRAGRAVDKDDVATVSTRGCELGARGFAAGVFGDDGIDIMLADKRSFTFNCEGRAVLNPHGIGKWFGFDGIDAAGEVEMLRGAGISGQFQSADGEENAAGIVSQQANCFFVRTGEEPVIASLRLPFGTGEAQERNARFTRGTLSIKRHDAGEWVCSIYECGDVVLAYPMGESLHTAETANAVGDGGQYRALGASGKRQGGADFWFCGEQVYEGAGLARAAKDEYVHE